MMHFTQHPHIGEITDVPLVQFATGTDIFGFIHGHLPEYVVSKIVASVPVHITK